MECKENLISVRFRKNLTASIHFCRVSAPHFQEKLMSYWNGDSWPAHAPHVVQSLFHFILKRNTCIIFCIYIFILNIIRIIARSYIYIIEYCILYHISFHIFRVTARHWVVMESWIHMHKKIPVVFVVEITLNVVILQVPLNEN